MGARRGGREARRSGRNGEDGGRKKNGRIGRWGRRKEVVGVVVFVVVVVVVIRCWVDIGRHGVYRRFGDCAHNTGQEGRGRARRSNDGRFHVADLLRHLKRDGGRRDGGGGRGWGGCGDRLRGPLLQPASKSFDDDGDEDEADDGQHADANTVGVVGRGRTGWWRGGVDGTEGTGRDRKKKRVKLS